VGEQRATRHARLDEPVCKIVDLIERGETGIPGEVIPLVAWTDATNNPAYRRLL